MKRLLLILSIGVVFFNSCSIVKFARYYASADSSPGKLRGRVYQTPYTSYEIGELDGDWKRISIKGGDLAFWNGKVGATITVNSTCNKDDKNMGYNLKALSESLVIGITDKELLQREEITVSGEKALQSVYSGNLDNVPVKLITVVMKRRNCAYDLTYASSPDGFDRGLNDFKGFVSQFKLIERK